LSIELAQRQPGEPYRLPLEIGIATDGATSPRIERIELNQPNHRFQFPAEKAPKAVSLDPNCWALFKATFAEKPRSP
jgi:hypothetical protein